MTQRKHADDNITIVEVSPRDGLPVACSGVSVEDKVHYIKKLAHTGLKYIESVSFTHPRLIPETADAEEVMARLYKHPGVTYIGLAPNEIGCRRALNAAVDDVLTLMAASETFNQLSMGQSRRKMLNKTLPAVFAVTLQAGKGMRSYLMTAFGCPYEGEVEEDEVIHLFWKLSHMGAQEIVLVDSTGMAHPQQVKEMVKKNPGLKYGHSLRCSLS